jgi:hypothetical protein
VGPFNLINISISITVTQCLNDQLNRKGLFWPNVLEVSIDGRAEALPLEL